MSKKSKSKYYVVWVGQNPGIYNNWTDCQTQIKGFPNAKYKAFKSKEEAERAFGGSAADHISNSSVSKKNPPKNFLEFESEIEKNSISVDAACSGNPGVMEYRAVDTYSGDEIFRMGPFKGGTNNVGEFLALIHALAYLQKLKDSEKIIYSDSRTALSWLRNKKVKTTLKQTSYNKDVFTLLNRAISWMKTNEVKNKVLKWDTERWGEIPADFGRK